MKCRFIYLTIVFMVLISGCASTKVSSFVDPEYRSEKYSKPIVWGKIAPLGDRKTLEFSFTKKLKAMGISSIPGIEVFSPTRELTKEYLVSALKGTDADSILIITLKSGSSVFNMQYDVKLLDNKFYVVWVGSAETQLQHGGVTEDSTNEIIFESVADEVVNQLISDGVM